MKALHLNYAKGDGAGNAVERIHSALLGNGIDSHFLYLRPHDATVSPLRIWKKKLNGLQNLLVAKVVGGDAVNGYPAINLFPTKVLQAINRSDADIVHLHWVQGEMLSIAQIAKIRKPMVWTFHSMWPFLGMKHWEHQRTEVHHRNLKLETGNLKKTISNTMQQTIDRWTYHRKEKHWKNLQCRVVCPSHWMADCARRSELFGNPSISVIPNCLDLDIFRPLENRRMLRKQLGLPENKNVLLFGATQPGALRKGGDLISAIIQGLENKSEYVLAIFGTKEQRVYHADDSRHGVQTHHMGTIGNEETMAQLYNVADVMCVPSRMDNLPSTCVEAQACGVPAVAFNVGGIPDIVEHLKSGYLAQPFDLNDFRAGIRFALDMSESQRIVIREQAAATFSMERVAGLHAELYRDVLKNG